MRLVGSMILMGALLAGCADPQPELEYGLGEKADGVCDETGPLCWPTADLDAMNELVQLRMDVGSGALPPEVALDEARAVMTRLEHKLSADELESIAEADSWDALGAATARVEAAHLTAQAIPIGRILERQIEGKSDDLDDDDDDDGPSVVTGADLTASLARLKESGLAGRVYAVLLKLSGVLSVEFEIMEKETFRAEGASREERVDAIINSRSVQAGLVGLGTGAISLIPGGGLLLSVPLESVGIFALHSRMAFAIAAIYGWDLNEGDNLYVITMILLTDGQLGALGDEMAQIPSIPALVRKLAKELGVPITTTLAVRLTAKAVAFGVRTLAKKSAELLSKSAASALGEAAAQQLLGWASLGLGVIASGVADYYITQRVGEHVALLARPWLIDLPIEGTRYLSLASDRACYADALAAIAHADGVVSPEERMMFDVLLTKPYYRGDGDWTELGDSEVLALTTRFESPTGDPRCTERFEDEATRTKLIAYSHIVGMAVIDGEMVPAEGAHVADQRDILDGAGFFDGPEISTLHLDFVTDAVTQAVLELDLAEEWSL